MPSSKLKLRGSLRSAVNLVVMFPILFIIGIAVFLSVSSVMENMHFARATSQVVSIVAAVRDYAAREKQNNLQVNEDLLASLSHLGTVPDVIKDGGGPAHLINPWGGNFTASVPATSTMRLETLVPVRDCRRLAVFFANNAMSIGLKYMEAREDNSVVWRRFLDTDDKSTTDTQPIEAACGNSSKATLALVFGVQ